MANEVEKVAEQALALPELERLSLARRLLESVEPQANAEVDRAWEDEIVRRVAQIDGGTAVGRSWEEIKRDFDCRYGG